jgi:hypothetical protein
LSGGTTGDGVRRRPTVAAVAASSPDEQGDGLHRAFLLGVYGDLRTARKVLASDGKEWGNARLGGHVGQRRHALG